MAGLRFAVLLAASSFGVLLLAPSASASSRPPAVFFVGDEWRAALASKDGTRQTLSKWAMRQRFYVGDVLDFKRSNGSILLVRRGDYERCSAASPALRFFGDGGGEYTRFTLAYPGLFYFISGAPARCEAGQRMVVRAPTPAPLAPVPVWFKLLVPAVIGFLGGIFLGGVLIMWPCRMNMLRLAGRA